ncbi:MULTISPECIES: hypothetical protein [unclassified Pseudoalteromonas]|uniref:hypothetical protein n=1 Tax=unclassified Pseudoalteromonas TaxID=194690 RepID=UPI002097BD22|nr:hypothetical protein [Pseudoalteromonas sp. XMcav2-N]MCO7187867.1 hypothetical protein [Pseudoalteromonas sp. XMcav2-N]
MKKPNAAMPVDELARAYPVFDAVTGWYFRCREVGPGQYLAQGRDQWGRSVSAHSTDHNTALTECTQFARDIQHRERSSKL